MGRLQLYLMAIVLIVGFVTVQNSTVVDNKQTTAV